MQLVTIPALEDKKKQVKKVVSANQKEILSIQMKEGEMVPEHEAKEDVFVIVKSGEVLFIVEGQEVTVTASHILHISPHEKHSLKAITDTEILVVKA